MRLFLAFVVVSLAGCKTAAYYQTHREPPPKVAEFKSGKLLPADIARYVFTVKRDLMAALPVFAHAGGFLVFQGGGDSLRASDRGVQNVLAQSKGEPLAVIFMGENASLTAKAVKRAVKNIADGRSYPYLHIVYVGDERETAAVEAAVKAIGAVYYFEKSTD